MKNWISGKFKYSTPSGKAWRNRQLRKATNTWNRKKGKVSFLAKARKAAAFSLWKKAYAKSRNLKRVIKKKFRSSMPLAAVKNIYQYLGRPFPRNF